MTNATSALQRSLASHGVKEAPTTTIVIATRHRAEPLEECLESLRHQTLKPTEVIIVDSSSDDRTRALCERTQHSFEFRLMYRSVQVRSSAIQRNIGVDESTSDFVVFLDDDVVLDPQFLAELLPPFNQDEQRTLGGVCGTITNDTPAPMSPFNRAILRMVLGVDPRGMEGRLIGPAIQMPHRDGSGEVIPVDWLPSGVTAYRRSVLNAYRFGETFKGYSFMEDVDLSARIGRQYKLVQATGARLFHKALGSTSHVNWIAHGEDRILNRHYVMAHAMGKSGFVNLMRLFAYELGYCTLAGVRNAFRGGPLKRTLLQFFGGVRGAAKIVAGRSPHFKDRSAQELAMERIR